MADVMVGSGTSAKVSSQFCWYQMNNDIFFGDQINKIAVGNLKYTAGGGFDPKWLVFFDQSLDQLGLHVGANV